MITWYILGVVLMAIAIVYFNYDILHKLMNTWQFWFSFILLCLLSWLGIVIVIVLTIKHVISNSSDKNKE